MKNVRQIKGKLTNLVHKGYTGNGNPKYECVIGGHIVRTIPNSSVTNNITSLEGKTVVANAGDHRNGFYIETIEEVKQPKRLVGADKLFFGKNKDTNERIYITKPKWDCDWYWSFGYLGNNHCHYHLSGYQSKDQLFKLEDGTYKSITEKRNINMHNALLADYELNPKIKENLWQFCELALTIYQLKETAEVLGRGGSHMTTNPCAALIKDPDYVHHINREVLPEVMQTLWDLISG